MAVQIPVSRGYSVVYGSGTGQNGGRINVWLEYFVERQDVIQNKSRFVFNLYAALKETAQSQTSGADGLYSTFVVNGEELVGYENAEYDFRDPDILNDFGGYMLDIPHDANGEASVSITATFKTKSNYIKGGTVSATIKLPTIQRATIPTVPSTVVAMGSNLVISLPRASVQFVHDLSYGFGSETGVIATDAATSATWSVPLELASLIPTEKSGECVITCATKYNGEVIETETLPITLTVPEDERTKPIVSMAIAPELAIFARDSAATFIQNKTRVVATFEATAQYTTIKDYTLSVGGVSSASVEPVITSEIIGTSGKKQVVGRVTDARGYYTEVSYEIDVIPYAEPRLIAHTGDSAVICERCDNTGTPNSSGLYLLIRAARAYSPIIVDGVQNNFCEIRYRWKMADADSFGDWNTLLATDSPVDEINAVVGGDFLQTMSYVVEIGVIDSFDAVGGVPEFYIPTDKPTFHLGEGGNKAAFGKYATHENALEVVEDWEFYVHGMTIKEYIQAVINGKA